MSKYSQDFNNIDLKKLGDKLSINYYNVSLVPSDKNINFESKEIVFSKKIGDLNTHDFSFSRNILIVGAGASKSSFESINVADEVTINIYKDLSFMSILSNDSNQVIWNKFIHQANNYSKRFYDIAGDEEEKKATIKKIISDLSFEENLSLLRQFINREDIIKALYNNIGYSLSSYPSLFYEVIAHMFKHRFIDIIINLNFDELLDNAIEDAMGNTTYYRIIDQGQLKDFSQIAHNDRLRIPIYVKPHGSAFSKSSIRFTNEHYNELSSDLKRLLNDIFSDKVFNENFAINNFNILSAGYGFNDFDINNILFHNLNDSMQSTCYNYYIFDLKADEVRERIYENFAKWIGKTDPINKEAGNGKRSSDKKIQEEYQNIFVSRSNSKITCFKCVKSNIDYSVFDRKNIKSLGRYYLNLYKMIRGNFSTPFTPQLLTRHELIIDLFPREVIIKNLNKKSRNDNIDTAISSTTNYLLMRAVCMGIYELVKFKGVVPKDVLSTGRISKYYQKFREAVSINNSSSEKVSQEDRSYVEILNDFLRSHIQGELKLKNNTWNYVQSDGKPFDWDTDYSVNSIIKGLVSTLWILSFNKKETAKEEFTKKYCKLLKQKIKDTKYYNINTRYNDGKLNSLYYLNKNQYINTNLNLTWKMFDFTINRLGTDEEWDDMYIIDDTGKALINLIDNFSNHINYKKVLNKNIKFVYTMNTVNDTLPRYIDTLHKKLTNFDSIYIPSYFVTTNMVVFLKKDHNSKLVPRYGIYYFKNAGRININPVWFDRTKYAQTSTKNNLEYIHNIFLDSWNLAKWLEKNEYMKNLSPVLVNY